MKPIVYLYEEQLQEVIIDGGSSKLKKGVAFEWKGEDVFHVHTKFPKVAPSGYPSIAFFRVEKNRMDFENSKDNFQLFSESIYNAKISNNQTVIGVFLFLDENKLNQLAFIKTNKGLFECEVKFVPHKSELYSRNKGLIEVDMLESKNVLIIGLGSFGSQIAVELAKSGVGRFTLIDFDRIELSNISRHICGVNELGRFKTHAIRDAILVKNPFAQVKTYEINVNDNRSEIYKLVQVSDIVICTTDNNRSRFNINEIAFELNKVVLFGRAVTRAEGGDVFKLNGKNGPCYCCLIGEHGGLKYGGEEEITSTKQANEVLPSYISIEDKKAAVQVGLSSDILPICNLLVKLSLLEMSKGLNSGISSLESELTYDYYFWANRREKNYLSYEPFNNSKGRPSILRWYGVNIPPNPECFICASIGGNL